MKNGTNGSVRGELTLELLANELYIRLDQLPGEVIAADAVDRGVKEKVLTGYVFRSDGVSNIYFTRSGLEKLSREIEQRLGAKLRKALRQLHSEKEFKTADDLKTEYPKINPKEYTLRDGEEETFYLAELVIANLRIAGREIHREQTRNFMRKLAEGYDIEATKSPTGQLVYSSAQASQIMHLTNQAEIEYFRQKEANKP